MITISDSDTTDQFRRVNTQRTTSVEPVKEMTNSDQPTESYGDKDRSTICYWQLSFRTAACQYIEEVCKNLRCRKVHGSVRTSESPAEIRRYYQL